MKCKICLKECKRTKNVQKYCKECSKVQQYKQNRKWYEKNKEIYKKSDTYKRQKARDRQHNKFNYKIRWTTYHHYGKLPLGWEYHHTTKPYHEDKFICVHKSEHKDIDRKYRG